ncbi:aminopeptidase [candidate division KSB1 bacterium]|nr:MAG: aminopeptidase [candidate division KSB1 bacterium]
MKESLKAPSLIALRDCMAVKKGESVLIITDENKREIGYALWETAKELETEAMILEIIPTKSDGEEPPRSVAEIMKSVDVLLCPTTKSLSHTDARRNASKAGVRIATLPGITEDTLVRTLDADYNRIAELSIKLAKILTEAKIIRVTTEKGTDITMPVEGREGHEDTGLVHKPGDFANLPAGEAYIAPLEEKSNGVFVVDGAMAGLGVLKETFIKIKVVDGYATEISGGPEAEKLIETIEPFGKPGRNIAEFGIGTNYKAQITGSPLEDEKIIGTIHIALGDNVSMGGTVNVPSHLDGIIRKPTVEIDGKIIMKNGEFMI